MPSLNILTLNQGDTQADIRNKVNANFDSLVANGGGPQGVQGPQGEQGPVGPVGPQGDPGQQGTRGTKWFVQATGPTGGVSNPCLVGDYWVDTFNNNDIYEFGPSGWTFTGSSLQSTGVFTLLPGISGPISGMDAIVINSPFPNLNTLVLSDDVSTPSTANPSNSKILISTDSANDFPLLEFAKTNATGIGTPADYNRHPQFRWLNPSQSNYNLLFSVPQDAMTFTAGGNMTLQSTNSILSLNSSSDLSIESGAGMTVTSAGNMAFNSGISLMEFTSANYSLSSGLLSLAVPLSITNNTTGTALFVQNQNATGSGLSVTLNTSNLSYTIANFISGGISRFNVRADGKVSLRQSGTAVKFITGSANLTYSGIGYWNLGPNYINFGNLIYFEPPAGSPATKGFLIPVGNFSTSWTSFLQNYESIQIRIAINSTGNRVRYVSLYTGSGNPGVGSNTQIDFGSSTPQQFLEITIIRTNSAAGYIVYYNTCGGLCGKF
jgi:hypothetical protein